MPLPGGVTRSSPRAGRGARAAGTHRRARSGWGRRAAPCPRSSCPETAARRSGQRAVGLPPPARTQACHRRKGVHVRTGGPRGTGPQVPGPGHRGPSPCGPPPAARSPVAVGLGGRVPLRQRPSPPARRSQSALPAPRGATTTRVARATDGRPTGGRGWSAGSQSGQPVGPQQTNQCQGRGADSASQPPGPSGWGPAGRSPSPPLAPLPPAPTFPSAG